MNIALEGTREFVDGKMRRSYGDAFVRGNNGAFFFAFKLLIIIALCFAWRACHTGRLLTLWLVTVTYISADS